METQAHPLRQNRFPLLLGRPWASRLLATLGIVVMTVGLDVPVVGRDYYDGSPFRFVQTWAIRDALGVSLAFLHVGRRSLLLALGLDALFSLLTLGGLALIPLLWQPLSPKGTAWLRWTYAAWLSLLTILTVACLPAMWRFVSGPLPGPLSQPLSHSGNAPYILPGAVVFPLGALLSAAALSLIFREPLPASAPAPAPRTGWQWTSALVLTAGVLVWGIGFYLMPEAITGPCPPVIFSVTHFARGACAGIDSDQVLIAAYNAGLNPITSLFFTVGRNFELLVAIGCITALGGWTRQLSVRTLAWLAAWPVLALGVALVALQGVGVVAQRGFLLTIATGTGWHMAAGMVVTFVGIGLVALGQVGLWRELVRRKGIVMQLMQATGE